MRFIAVSIAVAALMGGVTGAFLTTQSHPFQGASLVQAQGNLSVNRLGALTEAGRVRTSLKAGDQFWGVAMVGNKEADPLTFDWTMTLDGTLISYGGWTLPAGKTALLTSITSTTAVAGSHTLTFTATVASVVVAQSSATVSVR